MIKQHAELLLVKNELPSKTLLHYVTPYRITHTDWDN